MFYKEHSFESQAAHLISFKSLGTLGSTKHLNKDNNKQNSNSELQKQSTQQQLNNQLAAKHVKDMHSQQNNHSRTSSSDTNELELRLRTKQAISRPFKSETNDGYVTDDSSTIPNTTDISDCSSFGGAEKPQSLPVNMTSPINDLKLDSQANIPQNPSPNPNPNLNPYPNQTQQLQVTMVSSQKNYKQLENNDDEEQDQKDITTTNSFKFKLNSSSHFSVTWENIDYIVGSKWCSLRPQRKVILNSLNGSFRSGKLTAVLGPSGAGKSTLINCLIGRRANMRGLSGSTRVIFDDLTLERERRKNETLRIAVIPQQDHHLSSLTVIETLYYSSLIKNAAFGSSFDHRAAVDKVLKDLSLESCGHSKCSKLSGGQLKRVSIGQELLASPDVLILDEPTSGLDSVTCFKVIDALKQLVERSAATSKPLAILATIHQPDIEVFELFDKVYVLAHGGHCVYEGSASRDICDSVHEAAQVVRANRKFAASINKFQPTNSKFCDINTDTDNKLEDAQQKAACPTVNPARLIVEVAAGTFGNELVASMVRLHDSVTSIGDCQNVGAQSCASSTQTTTDSAVSSQKNSDLFTTIDLTNVNKNDHDKDKDSNSNSNSTSCSNNSVNSPTFDYEKHQPNRRKKPQADPMLCLEASNARIARSTIVFVRHVRAHASRSWRTIIRDPMLCSVQIILHIVVPLLLSYCFQLHDVDACPRFEPLDLIAEAYAPANSSVIDEVNKELRFALEAQGYFFIQLFVIIFAAICGYALTYPLSAKVLVKEYRNGAYSMASYFLGRTLADMPICVLNVVMALAISYFLTGQAHSYMEWRFASFASLTVLATLVAQTQGLFFGAILMDSPQSTVFVAPASTAPMVVVSGFLLRIKSLPVPLQLASKLSYFTHMMSGAIISRYGFNKCNCNESLFVNGTFNRDNISENSPPELPIAASNLINMWIETYEPPNSTLLAVNGTTAITQHADLPNKLLNIVARAKTFGYEMHSCQDVRPFSMLDYNLHDYDLAACYGSLVAMLVVFRLLAYVTLRWKVNKSL